MKKVLVIGLARSGFAAIRMLHHLGEDITLNTYEALDERTLEQLKSYNVTCVTGSHPLSLVDEGFDYVVKNPGVPMLLPIIQAFKAKQVPVLTEIELGYRVCPQLKYIAITGTNGKTTTTTLTYQLLKASNENVYLAGNIGIPLCEVILENNLFNKEGIIVLEIAGFQLLDTVLFRPTIAAILNLAPDHLDYFPSVESYYDSKLRIYQQMKDQDVLLINGDDIISTELIDFKGIIKTIQLTGLDTHVHDGNIIIDGKVVVSLDSLHVVGKHNVYNAMFAVTIAHLMGVSNHMINTVLASFTGVEHRIEYVTTIHNVRYYNDSKATNVDSVVVAVEAFNEPIILLLGGKDKGLDYSVLTQYKQIKAIICFGEAAHRIKTYFNEVHLASNLKEAVDKAKQLAMPGNVVLLSPGCSSYDEFENFEQRGRVFKDYVLN